MNYLKKCLEDKENFIIITSAGSLTMRDINKALINEGTKYSIYEAPTTPNPITFSPIPAKEIISIKPDVSVPQIQEQLNAGKDTIVVVSEGQDANGKNDFMIEAIKSNVLTTLNAGARSIVVMEDMNNSNTSLIYSFKNEEEFLNIIDIISIGAKVDLSDQLEKMRAANTRKPSKVKPD